MKQIKNMSGGLYLALIMLIITVISCAVISLYGSAGTAADDRSTSVLASFYPVYITAQNLLEGIDDAAVSNLSDPQTGCLHDYTLTPEDMKQLSVSDIFIINGGGIEAFLPDVVRSYPSVKIIDAGADLTAPENYPLSDNQHYWMSLMLYREQVQEISNRLKSELTSSEDIEKLTSNTSEYLSKLDSLKNKADLIKPLLAGTDVILFHEAYEYIACDYDMNVRYILDLDEERQVSAGEVAEVIDYITKYNIPFILVEEIYGKATAETVAKQTGVDILYLDTITRENPGDTSDSFIERMTENINRLSSFGSR